MAKNKSVRIVMGREPDQDGFVRVTTLDELKDSSVDDARISGVVERLEIPARIAFVNTLHRVLKPGAACTLVCPHWSSSLAYGDLRNAWPPVSEFWFYHLNREWRKTNAPDELRYTCDFETTWGYGLNESMAARNQEFQQFATMHYRDVCQVTIATLRKR